MARMSLLVALLALSTELAWAGQATGHSGLALAALIAANSPTLAASDKSVLAALFDGKLTVSFPAGKKISVQADTITCAAGNVDITYQSCQMAFGKTTVSLSGRKAHEIFATLVEVGVPSDGAAGTIYESLSHLNCTVDPNEVKQSDGSGVDCKFTAGPS